MSFFKALGSLAKATVGVAMLPIDAVVDAATLGGVIIDKESALVRRLRKVSEDTGDAYEETFGDD